MFSTTLFLSTATLALVAAVIAYARTRDALHPAVVVGPLMAYGYGVWPLVLNRDGQMLEFIAAEGLERVALLYLVALAIFLFAMVVQRRQSKAETAFVDFFQNLVERPDIRRRLCHVASILGVLAVGAYWYMIVGSGGFVDAYSRAKGGGRADSGFIGEAILLSFPAIAFLALSRLGRQVRVGDVVLALIFASPHLIQGTFGGRRGPLFLALGVLFFAWYLARGRRPTFRTGLLGVSAMALAVVLVWSQRQEVYLGSGGSFEMSRVFDVVSPDELDVGNEYLTGAATVLTNWHHEHSYMGHRYFVIFFIRPIPRQIWPTKYEDMGATWLEMNDENTRDRYLEAVGFAPVGGASVGLLADLHMEFSWGMLIVVGLLGWFYGWLWRKHRENAGLWTVLYLELILLSIYLPVQSLSAVMHRFLFMALITIIVWRFWLDRRPSGRRDRASPSLAVAGDRTVP